MNEPILTLAGSTAVIGVNTVTVEAAVYVCTSLFGGVTIVSASSTFVNVNITVGTIPITVARAGSREDVTCDKVTSSTRTWLTSCSESSLATDCWKRGLNEEISRVQFKYHEFITFN